MIYLGQMNIYWKITNLQIWHGICSQVWESGHIEDSLEQSPSQPTLAEWFDDPVRSDIILTIWYAHFILPLNTVLVRKSLTVFVKGIYRYKKTNW